MTQLLVVRRMREQARALRTDNPGLAAELDGAIREAEASSRERAAAIWAAELAAAVFAVDRDRILAGGRLQTALSKARGLAMALCMARFEWSACEVARVFRVDPQTVFYAVRRLRGSKHWAIVEAETR